MGRIISIANQKGGVGKSTTAINLGAFLALAEQRILLIDMDPQGNTSTGIGIDVKNIGNTIYELIIGSAGIETVINKTQIDNLSIIPADINLIGAEIELVNTDKREYVFKGIIRPIAEKYDYILIDTPPSLNILTLNALVASDSVLIPIQCEYLALEGVGKLMNTIKLVKKSLNVSLEIEGILLTMYDNRTNLSKQVEGEVKNFFGDKVFKSVIPRNIKLSESPGFGQPIVLYDVNSKGAESYASLAKEIMTNER